MISRLGVMGKNNYHNDGCTIPVRLGLHRNEIRVNNVIHSDPYPGAIMYHYERLGEDKQRVRLEQWARYHRRARTIRSLVGQEDYVAVTYEFIVQQSTNFLRCIAQFLNMPMFTTTIHKIVSIRCSRTR